MIGFVFSEGVILIMIQNRFRHGQGIPVSCFRVVFPFAALALLGLFVFWGCGAPRRPAFDPNYVPKEKFQMVREPGGAKQGGARVENLVARQEGRDAVLTYDLIGAGATDEVVVEISLDEGKTWTTPKGLWGHVGKGVTVGKGKRIQWAATEQFPRGVSEEVRFRVVTMSERDRSPTAAKETVTFTGNGVSFKMVRIPAGEFMMGSPSNEPGRYSSDEGPQHRVRISKDFWIGQTEVTQGLWKAVMGSNPSYFSNCGDDCPVEQVSWSDCQEFIRKLNGMVSGGNFRLPTEAEWEYACRAGTTGPYAGDLDAMGWYSKNSGSKTHGVGQKKGNAWGLHDMHGNVWEWCQDWYGDYPSGSVTDPTGPSGGAYRVNRGGSWGDSARHCRSANRSNGAPDYRDVSLGFRLARTN